MLPAGIQLLVTMIMFNNNILNLHVQYTEQFDIDFLLWPGNYTGLYREVGQGGGGGGGEGKCPPDIYDLMQNLEQKL